MKIEDKMDNRNSAENIGIFLKLSPEVLFYLLDHFDMQSLFTLAMTSHYLSNISIQKFTQQLNHPDFILNCLSTLPAQDILRFTRTYFRPIGCALFQNLEQKLPSELETDSDYKAMLCYTLLTDDIKKLKPKDLIKLDRYINNKDSLGYRYHIFSDCIRVIHYYLIGNVINFNRMFLKFEVYEKGTPNSISGSIYYCHHNYNLNHTYKNLAGATFTDGWFHHRFCGDELHDLRSTNLENTIWNDCSINNIIFGGSNLENAYFKNMNISACNFWRTHARNVTFDHVLFNHFVFLETNLEGACFKNIDRWIDLYSCNLQNTSFINIKLFYLHLNAALKDMENINFFEGHEFNSLEVFASKLDHMDISTKDKDAKYCDQISNLRYAFAHNIKQIIHSLDTDINKKLRLLSCAIDHPIFQHRHQFRYAITTFARFFSDSYQAPPTDSQKILLGLLDDLESVTYSCDLTHQCPKKVFSNN